MSEIFSMGKHTFFVWGSYSVVFIGLTLLFILPLMYYRQIKRTLKRRYMAQNK